MNVGDCAHGFADLLFHSRQETRPLRHYILLLVRTEAQQGWQLWWVRKEHADQVADIPLDLFFSLRIGRGLLMSDAVC